MKKAVAALMLVWMLATLLLPIAAEPVVPFDGEVAKVQAAVADSVGKDTPGAAVVLIKEGERVMADGFGYADLGTRVLVTPDTSFEIGRLSSLFVTLSALRLAQEGKLDLDAGIAAYLPSDFMAKLALLYPVTTRQLLAGRAGFGGRVFDVAFENDAYCFADLKEALLADVPQQVTKPGLVSAYSPFSVALAAFVVENIAGVAYEQYAVEQILQPLGLTDTVLRFDADTAYTAPSCGYQLIDIGSFGTTKRQGRTYAGLYPAIGAASTAADLSRLLCWLFSEEALVLNVASKAALFEISTSGIFSSASLAFRANGSVFSLSDQTAYYGAALYLDPAAKTAVLVLTNTAENTLLSLPEKMLGRTDAVAALPTGDMLELKVLKGTYASLDSERHTFVGRFFTMQQGIPLTVNDDGTVTFLGMRLVQIAPGVLADADVEGNVPVLQFLLDDEGEVAVAITATGACYTPLPFYYARVPATFLFGLLLLLGAWFLLTGIVSLFKWLTFRNEKGEREGLCLMLPDLLAAVLALFVAAQILLANNYGTAVLSSAYFALQIISLLFAIGATVMYVIAFALSITERKTHHRVAFTAIMFVIFLLLVCFWGLTVI